MSNTIHSMMINKPTLNKMHGFTMIELVTALIIIVILTSYAIGPLRSLLLRNQVSNQTNLIQLDLSFARSEAISRAYPTMIIPNENWVDGWDIVIDKNDNGIFDEGEEKVRTSSFENKTITLVDAENNQPITFTSLGSLKSAQERVLEIKHAELKTFKMIVIAAAGSISIRSIENDSE